MTNATDFMDHTFHLSYPGNHQIFVTVAANRCVPAELTIVTGEGLSSITAQSHVRKALDPDKVGARPTSYENTGLRLVCWLLPV